MLTKQEIAKKELGFIPNPPLKGGGNRRFRRAVAVEGVTNNRGNCSHLGQGVGTVRYVKQIVNLDTSSSKRHRKIGGKRVVHHFIPKVNKDAKK